MHREVTQEFHPPGHTKACNFGSDGAQPTLAARGRKIHVYPWQLVGKALQEPHREDVIRAALQDALLDIGNAALERLIVIVVERKYAHSLSARRAGGHCCTRQLFAGGEDAAVAVA